jgi:hypothetical protein
LRARNEIGGSALFGLEWVKVQKVARV